MDINKFVNYIIYTRKQCIYYFIRCRVRPRVTQKSFKRAEGFSVDHCMKEKKDCNEENNNKKETNKNRKKISLQRISAYPDDSLIRAPSAAFEFTMNA